MKLGKDKNSIKDLKITYICYKMQFEIKKVYMIELKKLINTKVLIFKKIHKPDT
jgi:hypothetical protein